MSLSINHQRPASLWKSCRYHGRPQDFFGLANEGIWRTEVLQRGLGADPQWEFEGEASRSWHFLKIMHKYFVYWDFRRHLQNKKQFTTFPTGAHGRYVLPRYRNELFLFSFSLRRFYLFSHTPIYRLRYHYFVYHHSFHVYFRLKFMFYKFFPP